MFDGLFKMVSEGFRVLGIKIEHQAETEIIKTVKKSYKQEDLILDMAKLISKYMNNFNAYDRFRAKCYLKRIKKVN